MKAYLVSQLEVIDEEAFARYRELSAPALLAHGGRYLVRGRAPEVVEADWEPPHAERQVLVVAEFPDAESIHAWYASQGYQEALQYPDKAVRRRMLFIDGVPDGPTC